VLVHGRSDGGDYNGRPVSPDGGGGGGPSNVDLDLTKAAIGIAQRFILGARQVAL